jgi:preprotein translocase subunit SecA
MSSIVLSKKIAQGFYPERRMSKESKLDSMVIGALGSVRNLIRARPGRFYSIIKRVNALQDTFRNINENELKILADRIRKDIKTNGISLNLVARVFALVREVAGLRLGMRHFDVQLMGGWALLKGMVAEMETGEGKTLTATLPACVAALAGIPVHIITVNDYLARRDADWMSPIYEALGLRVGVIKHGMSLEERRSAYGCDVTYCTNKEIIFDYLKDRLLFGQKPGHIQMRVERLHGTKTRLDQLLLRGLSFAIVDEADSVLIDEARTPHIISGPVDNTFEEQVYKQSLVLSAQLKSKNHFTIDVSKKALDLTEQGKSYLKQIAQPLNGIWKGKHLREELVRQALTAQHLFFRDKDYIVRNKKVQIVDEYTGRVMADRTWEHGLHQLIEVKEGCNITQQNETMARMSYQRFFRRYHHLAGMTGTAKEVARELWSVYRLPVVSIPTHKPMIRRAYPTKVYTKKEEKWDAIVKKTDLLYREGRPVLVGTRSVEASEYISKLLTEARLPHRVLNARQGSEEAEIIAQAGKKGKITVATNMAGRGTDITLTTETKELGGLHVIATEHHDARRIDRQLFGRCGRQGDPGSYEMIASMEDDLLVSFMEKNNGSIMSKVINPDTSLGRWIGNMYASRAQQREGHKHYKLRRDLMRFDESIDKAIAFSGSAE